MASIKEIPDRKNVPEAHRWKLNGLFPNDEAWEKGIKEFETMISKVDSYKEKLSASSDGFYETLMFYKEFSMLEERLGSFAFLRQSEDEGNSDSRGRMARYMMSATKGAAAFSWMNPEIQGIDDKTIDAWMKEERFSDFRIFISKLLRFKPHVLSKAEERLLALSIDAATTPQETFSVLTNVDFNFGSVETPEGPRVLSQSTFSSLMQHRDREVRKAAYLKFYGVYDAHKHSLAQLYAGQCKHDDYSTKARNYSSSRARELFPDNVPETVYDNLVSVVNNNLPKLHAYYELRKKTLGLSELRHYDVYVPLVGQVKVEHTWEEAVELISKALKPLGEEYVSILKNGLLGGWADRYENKGKTSGAFSAGSFFGDPYILMNFKNDVIRDVFTLVHEGGHSMHSYYAVKNNPFMHYNYTIFEAEVASTFNEALLFDYMIKNTDNKELKTYLLSSRVDDLLATLFRQTMFAEYEHKAHAMLETGEPLTVDALREEYGKLLKKYFGPAMVFEDTSNLEGLRIPHFYNSYYVYKYATGISASIALSKKVLAREPRALENYYAFLKSGGSRFPIDALKLAGVDMSSPAPVEAACDEFGRLVNELKVMLG